MNDLRLTWSVSTEARQDLERAPHRSSRFEASIPAYLAGITYEPTQPPATPRGTRADAGTDDEGSRLEG